MSEDGNAVALEIGSAQRVGVGRGGRRPAFVCVETLQAMPGGGAFIAGWVVDPHDGLSALEITSDTGPVNLTAGRRKTRPDVIAAWSDALGRGASASQPGFESHVPRLSVASSIATITARRQDGTAVALRVPISSDLSSTLDLARQLGWEALRPYMPQEATELTETWRDALLGLMWLLPDESPDVTSLEAYLLREAAAVGQQEHEPAEAAPPDSAPAEQLPAPTPVPAPAPHGRRARRALRAEMKALRNSELFDADWYAAQYPDVLEANHEPLEHFCRFGWREGRDPGPAFSTLWYLAEYPDVAAEAINPLRHYLGAGEAEGRLPHPGGLPHAETPESAAEAEPRPLPEGPAPTVAELFDEAFYLETYPDVRDAGADPLAHYLEIGHLEGRDASPDFYTAYYRAKYLGSVPELNPLVHYAQVGYQHSHHTKPGPHDLENDLAAQVRFRTNTGPDFEELDETIGKGREALAKVMAFYLPQFHTILENDQWWGKGFTEWRNVMRGVPRFAGHYQPRIPRDLGFYDLSNPAVLPEQVRLAKAAGVHGFCFHYYWFNGKRLLERPLDQFLADPSLDLTFSVAWANENWTRRWDGLESEVLMAQEYDPTDDEALIDDLQRYFSDPRYLRIEGRPVLTIYRGDIVPDPRETFARWRAIWKSHHSEEPLILLAQTFGVVDPRDFGLDGAVEFPPHKLTEHRDTDNHRLRILDPAFRSQVFDYSELADDSVADPAPPFPLIKTAVPSWDNDGRRQGRGGLILNDSSPARYNRWLAGLIDHARDNPAFGEPLVMVNAWNEWAEAAYLEPDVHYGSAYLNATARAVFGVEAAPEEGPEGRRKVLLVGHDAHPFGSQHLLHHIGDTMRNQFGCEVAYLLRSDAGEMTDHYERLGEVFVTHDDPARTEELLRQLAAQGFSAALTNTTATGSVVPYLKAAGFRVVSLIHELPRIVDEYGLGEPLRQLADSSDRIIFPADSVRDGFTAGLKIDPGKLVVRPQGSYHRVGPKDGDRARIRRELGVSDDEKLVMNAGSGDLRKGIDIFLHVAKDAPEHIHFAWVGKLPDEIARWLGADLDESLAKRLHLIGYTPEIDPYFAAADAFFLSSREDPYPAVVLEAMDAGLPVVALRSSGGIEDLVSRHGKVVDRNRTGEIVAALEDLMAAGATGADERRQVVDEDYRWDEYCFELVQMLHPGVRKISVAVPNYEYANLLEGRLQSIFDQTYPIFELIVLDDRSGDDSLDRIARVREASGRHLTVVPNDEQSGSAFRQWHRGSELARGDLLWIAEADDLARPELLERLARAHSHGVAYAFCDSSQIGEDSGPAGDSYKTYYRMAAGTTLDHDTTMDGKAFVELCLAQRNLILNVSAVLWDRARLSEELGESLDEVLSFRLAGDWFLYATVALRGGRIAYVSEPLNVHRRHDASVTGALDKELHLAEVERVHEMLKARLDLDASRLQRMDDYVSELRTQFGLKPTEAP